MTEEFSTSMDNTSICLSRLKFKYKSLSLTESKQIVVIFHLNLDNTLFISRLDAL